MLMLMLSGATMLGLLLPTASAVNTVDSSAAASTSSISVVKDIPGRARSQHYAVSAQGADAGGGELWQQAFVLETTAKDTPDVGYFSHLNGFTNSWASVMLGPENTAGVRLRVSRLVGPAIHAARIHPQRSGATIVAITGNGVEVLVPRPTQFTLTLDGGLDDVDTGPSYKGPPMHTFTAVVNPFLATPAGAEVVTVPAGHAIPHPLPPGTQALVFGPGEHRIYPAGMKLQAGASAMGPPPPSSQHWPVFTLPNSVRVHVPADAICYFALTGPPPPGRTRVNITLEGYGTFSGEEMSRCPPNSTYTQGGNNHRDFGSGTEPSDGRIVGEGKACGGAVNNSPQGLTLSNAHYASISGVTFVDYPNHHIITSASGNTQPCTEAAPSLMKNIKIFGWRANGDGIHVFGQWLVSDCFIRTQDDSMYLQSGSSSTCPTVFERITTWNDANGAAWMVIGHGATLRNSDAIYQRASWGFWDGGRILTNREQGSAIGITIDDVQFSDRFPTMNAINLDLRTGSSSGAPHLDPATVADVSIRNFHVAAFSTQTKCTEAGAGCNCVPKCMPGSFPRGFPNRILGGPDYSANNISSLSFQNCSIGGIDVGTLLRTRDPAFNVTWGAVSKITVDGQQIIPPDNQCGQTLEAVCGEHTDVGQECETCCGRHQHALRVAGCSNADCVAFCARLS